jgi:hypothetical protein
LWCWPCGQNTQPKPECHRRRDPRHEAKRQGFPVLTAGPVVTCQPASSTDSVGGFWPDGCSGVLAPLPPRGSRPRDRKQASKAMTRSGKHVREAGWLDHRGAASLAGDRRSTTPEPSRADGPETGPPRSESTLHVPERSRVTRTAERSRVPTNKERICPQLKS